MLQIDQAKRLMIDQILAQLPFRQWMSIEYLSNLRGDIPPHQGGIFPDRVNAREHAEGTEVMQNVEQQVQTSPQELQLQQIPQVQPSEQQELQEVIQPTATLDQSGMVPP